MGYGLGLTMLLSFLSSKGKQSVSGGDYKSVLVMDQYGNTYSVMVPQAVIEGGISEELGAGAAILGMTGGKGDSNAKLDLDKVDDSYLKKKGVDAHQLKKDIYGKRQK